MPDFARAQLRRQRINFGLFLGPALVLLLLFFVAPVIIDVVLAFTDMGRTLAVSNFTLENFERMVTRDTRLLGALGITFIFVLTTLGVFNVTFALLLALVTTAVPRRLGAFFRAVWLLPRMSPSVVYALLWLWVVDPNERGLLNQIVVHVFDMPPIDLRNNHPLLVSFEYILLITAGGPFYDTTVFSLYAYRRAFESGEYAYGAALSLILVVIGVVAALALWRLMDMRRLLQPPRIEVH